jgi:succinate dehydrogenase / fumarate reductase membrane anchor subunit
MEITRTGSKPRETSTLWMLKAFTGILIIVILGVHFVVNHIIGENSLLTYQDIVKYYTNPIVPLMEIAFVIFVVSHSLIGLRGIILDLKPSLGTTKVLDWAFVILGTVAVVYGIWLISVIVSRGMAG